MENRRRAVKVPEGKRMWDQVFAVKQVMEKYCEKTNGYIWHLWMWRRHIIEWVEGKCGKYCKCMLENVCLEGR